MTANNPQAFPTPEVWGAGNLSELKRCEGREGMTLRDYFAGNIIIGMISTRENGLRPIDVPNFAKDAYLISDAMLKEREKSNDRK